MWLSRRGLILTAIGMPIPLNAGRRAGEELHPPRDIKHARQEPFRFQGTVQNRHLTPITGRGHICCRLFELHTRSRLIRLTSPVPLQSFKARRDTSPRPKFSGSSMVAWTRTNFYAVVYLPNGVWLLLSLACLRTQSKCWLTFTKVPQRPPYVSVGMQ